MKIFRFRPFLLSLALLSTFSAWAADRRQVNVETAGTLSEIITAGAKYKITDLTITGNLNGDDIRFLREMAGADFRGNPTEGQLSTLDMSEANIVEGGNYYYRDLRENYLAKANTLPSFAQCRSLQKIKAPMSVWAHEENAFKDCSNLSEVTLPHSMDTGNYLAETFYGCHKMQRLHIVHHPDRGGHLFEDGQGGVYYGSYYKDQLKSARLLYVPQQTEGSFVAHEKTETVAFSALQDCSKISEVVLPEGLVTIMDSAFTRCTALRKVTIPSGCQSIGSKAFKCCTSLTHVSLPSQLQRLYSETFAYCTALQQVDMPESLISINSKAFHHCASLQSIYIPSRVESIDWWGLFLGCTSLNEIKVSPNNLFFEVIDGALYDIDAHRLLVCQRSQEVVRMKEGTTLVNTYAFQGCTRLRELTLCKSWPTLGSSLYLKSYDLLDVLDGSRWIDSGEGFSLSSLESVNVYTPDDTLRTYDGAVYEKVKSYNSDDTFWELIYCPPGKVSVRIPSWCKIISMNLAYLPKLREIHCEGRRCPSFSDDFYEGVDLSRITIYVPDGEVEQYKGGYGWKNFPHILPESTAGIEAVTLPTDELPQAIYNLQGIPVKHPEHGGVYLYKYENGRTEKVVVK